MYGRAKNRGSKRSVYYRNLVSAISRGNGSFCRSAHIAQPTMAEKNGDEDPR